MPGPRLMPHHHAQMRSLAEAGRSDQQIADEIGCSARTVLRYRKANAIPSRWTQPIPDHGTIAMGGRGCTCTDCRQAWHRYLSDKQRDAAARYDEVTRPTAARPRLPWTSLEQAKLLELVDVGTSHVDIALELGRSWSAIENKLGKLRRQLSASR